MKKGLVYSAAVAFLLLLFFAAAARQMNSRRDVSEALFSNAKRNELGFYFKESRALFSRALDDALSDAIAIEVAWYINNPSAYKPVAWNMSCHSSSPFPSVSTGNGSRLGWEGCCRNYCPSAASDPVEGGLDFSNAGNLSMGFCDYFEQSTSPDPKQTVNDSVYNYLVNSLDDLNSFLFSKKIVARFNNQSVVEGVLSVVNENLSISDCRNPDSIEKYVDVDVGMRLELKTEVSFRGEARNTTLTDAWVSHKRIILNPISEVHWYGTTNPFREFVDKLRIRVVDLDTGETGFDKVLHLLVAYEDTGGSECLTVRTNNVIYPPNNIRSGVEMCAE